MSGGRGTGFAYAKAGMQSGGGMMVVPLRVLLPGGVYAAVQRHKRDGDQYFTGRALWTGRRLLPEGPQADAEAGAYLVAYGIPKHLQREMDRISLHKSHALELRERPVPLQWCGHERQEDSAGITTVATVRRFDRTEWKNPWIAMPSRTGHGYEFDVEWEDGGRGSDPWALLPQMQTAAAGCSLRGSVPARSTVSGRHA